MIYVSYEFLTCNINGREVANIHKKTVLKVLLNKYSYKIKGMVKNNRKTKVDLSVRKDLNHELNVI